MPVSNYGISTNGGDEYHDNFSNSVTYWGIGNSGSVSGGLL